MTGKNLAKLAVSIAVPQAVGGLGALVTNPAVSGWYQELDKPGFTPPSWVFGPVWTLLYLLMGISLYLVWKQGTDKEGVPTAMVLFGVHLALNFLWSAIFFGMKSPGAAFAEIILLWSMILLIIWKFSKIHKWSAYLLIPYILWVTYAAALNYSIWNLNN